MSLIKEPKGGFSSSFSLNNSWPTVRTFGVELFSLSFDFWPYRPVSWFSEVGEQKQRIYKEPSLYVTGFRIEFILFGFGFWFTLKWGWKKKKDISAEA